MATPVRVAAVATAPARSSAEGPSPVRDDPAVAVGDALGLGEVWIASGVAVAVASALGVGLGICVGDGTGVGVGVLGTAVGGGGAGRTVGRGVGAALGCGVGAGVGCDVGAGVGGGVAAAWTLTVPRMNVCTAQKYPNVPA